VKRFMTLAMAVGLLAIPVGSAHAASPTSFRMEGTTTSFGTTNPAGAVRYRENAADTDPAQQREFRWTLQNMVGLAGGIPADGDHVDTAIVDLAGNVVFYNFANGEQAIVQGQAAKLDLNSAKGDVVGDLDAPVTGAGISLLTMYDNELGDVVGTGLLG